MGVCSQYRGVTLVLSRLAQLVERKTLNLVVVGSSPTVGAFFVFSFLVLLACLLACLLKKLLQAFFFVHLLSVVQTLILVSIAPVAQLAARGSHNPKVASSTLAGST